LYVKNAKIDGYLWLSDHFLTHQGKVLMEISFQLGILLLFFFLLVAMSYLKTLFTQDK